MLNEKQRADILNMDDWVRHWVRDEPDYAVGDQIVELLKPVLVHLLDRGLALNTTRRHRDNLRMLGQKVLDKMTQFPEIAPATVREALDGLLDGCSIGEGGPDLYFTLGDGDPELEAYYAAEQRQFDTTCRMVWKYRTAQARLTAAAGSPTVAA